MKKIIEFAKNTLLSVVTNLGKVTPQFWFFALGIVLASIGAERIHSGAGLLLGGLLLVWDTTRSDVIPPRK